MTDAIDRAERRLTDSGRFWVGRVGVGLKVTSRDGDRTVVVRAHEHAAGEAIVALAVIGAEGSADPRAMLEAAARIGAGAIAVMKGWYVVRYVIPNAMLDAAP